MPTSYTSLLGLALPVTGELSGTWGDEVNNYITQYLDASVAGTQTISSDTNVTLTVTNGTSLGTTSAQYMILNCTGARTAARTITVPASSRHYIVINGTTGGFAVNVVGAGPTTGISVANGERCVIAWDGSDYVKVASSVADGVTTISFGTTGLTPATATAGAVTVAGTLATANGGTGLTTFTAGNNALYSTSASALTAGTLPVAAGGTGQTTYTDGQLLIGNTSGNTLTKATLTQGSGVTITNGNGSITISATGSGGDAVLANNNAFTGANTFYNATGQTFGTATSTQDGIRITGRAGGSSSYRVTLTPTTLTASRTLTLPNVTDTVATIGTAQTFTAAQTFRAANAIRSEAASTQDAVVIAGRAGGTGSFDVTITPTTLTASRTVTLPNADINFTTGLGVAQGGTGTTSLTANNVILGNGTSAVQFVAPGASGNVLTSNGTTWSSTAPVSSGSLIFISSQTASASATISFTSGIDSTYDAYAIEIIRAVPSVTSNHLRLTVSTDGGASYLSANYTLASVNLPTSSAALSSVGATAQSFINLTPTTTSTGSIVNTANLGVSGWVYLWNPSSTGRFATSFDLVGFESNAVRFVGAGSNTSGSVNAVRFAFPTGSGNISTGTFRLYGIKNS